MTFKHYIEQLTPMVERLGDRNLYKSYERKKSINDIDLTVNKGLYENGKVDVHVSSDEEEKLLVFSNVNGNNNVCVVLFE